MLITQDTVSSSRKGRPHSALTAVAQQGERVHPCDELLRKWPTPPRPPGIAQKICQKNNLAPKYPQSCSQMENWFALWKCTTEWTHTHTHGQKQRDGPLPARSVHPHLWGSTASPPAPLELELKPCRTDSWCSMAASEVTLSPCSPSREQQGAHPRRTHCVPGAKASQGLAQGILPCPCCRRDNNEAQRGCIVCSESHSRQLTLAQQPAPRQLYPFPKRDFPT